MRSDRSTSLLNGPARGMSQSPSTTAPRGMHASHRLGRYTSTGAMKYFRVFPGTGDMFTRK